MKKIMLHSKNSGNTYNICQYIAEKSDITVDRITGATALNIDDADHIILCSGVYGGHVHKNLLQWITSQPSLNGKKVHLLLTWFGRGKSDQVAFKEVKKHVLNKEGILSEDFFHCYGKGFGVLRPNHPDRNDLDNALSWVKAIH